MPAPPRGPSAAVPAPKPERPSLEVQYHPADIRKRVRYFFLSRRMLRRWAVGGAGWLLLVAFGLYAAPRVVGSQLARSRHHALTEEQAQLGERLGALVQALGELEKQSDAAGVEMAKIYLAYGFDPDDQRGQGGYPFAAPDVAVPVFAGEIARGNRHRARIGEQLAVLDVFLDEVRSFEEAHRDQVRTTPSISPLRGDDFVLTSPFAQRRNPFTKGVQFHAGIDLAAPLGSPVHATADGVVVFSGWYSLKKSAGWWRYGKMVAIAHGDRFISLYGHCDELTVQTGRRVEQGDRIATVGNTGWSTSPHLHYEVRRRADGADFEPVDPRIYILDHRWRDEERLLVRARVAPELQDFEPLPSLFVR